MRAPILFIYHGHCFDGFTAAWVFEYFRRNNATIIDQPVEYYPATYGKEPPDCKGKEVWLVDFSYDRETMIKKIIGPSLRTVMLDHHKSAEAALTGILDEVRMNGLQRQNDKVVFDMKRSGAGILYDELNREAGKRAGTHTPSPYGRRNLWIVDYVEDRDLWNWALPGSKEVSAYYASIPMTFEAWDDLNRLGLEAVSKGGIAIQRYIDNFGSKAREQTKFEQIADWTVPTINVPYMNCSDHVGALCEENPAAPFAAGYFRRADGRWQFSLRSRGEFDVSKVAMIYGGGGHKNAAGFDVERLPWEPYGYVTKEDAAQLETHESEKPPEVVAGIPATLSGLPSVSLGENSE
jgi:uncharacterized protein